MSIQILFAITRVFFVLMLHTLPHLAPSDAPSQSRQFCKYRQFDAYILHPSPVRLSFVHILSTSPTFLSFSFALFTTYLTFINRPRTFAISFGFHCFNFFLAYLIVQLVKHLSSRMTTLAPFYITLITVATNRF